jgi:hypothetical protein
MTKSTYGENVRAYLVKFSFLQDGLQLSYRYPAGFIFQKVRITKLGWRAAPTINESTPVFPTAAVHREQSERQEKVSKCSQVTDSLSSGSLSLFSASRAWAARGPT